MDNDKTSPFKFGMKYFKKRVPFMVAAQILGFVAITLDLLIPLVMELFIDFAICKNLPETNSLYEILFSSKNITPGTKELFFHLVILTCCLLIGRLVLLYTRNVIAQHQALHLENDLRVATYNKLMDLDSQTLSEYNSGELLQTMNGDIIHFKEMFGRMIPTIIDAVFALCMMCFFLGRINLYLLIIPVTLAPIFIWQLRKFKRLATENYKKIRENNSNMNLAVQENIEAVRLVRAFTNEEFEKQKFNAANENLKNSHLKQIFLNAKFDVVFGSLRQAAYIGTVAVCTVLIFKGFVTVGFLLACSNYVTKIVHHLTQINNMLFIMQMQNVAGNKIMNFLNEDSKVSDEAKNQGLQEIENPFIEIKNLNLSFEGKDALKDVSIKIPYGKKLGIVGSTGSGKSLLLETLVKNYPVSSGEILLNGKDTSEYSLKTLRNLYSYVFQEAFLFSNTVESNIKFAKEKNAALDAEPTEEEKDEIIFAAKRARAHNFIEELPQKYKTVVGERGVGISGGQKQRLTIARALMKNSKILVLDDSTSALDVETERSLLQTIKTYYPEKTLIITAHRLSSVVDCDEIIYMDDGKIIERGSFDDLMKLGGHFAKVYKIQVEQQKSVLHYEEEKNA